MALVTQLGYLIFEVSRMDEWRRLCTDVLGFELTESARGGSVLCRMDERSYRLILEHGTNDRILAMGWEVRNPQELEKLQLNLTENSVQWSLPEPEVLMRRGVKGLMRFVDPFGYTNEVFYGPTITTEKFKPGRAIGGFVTGTQGLGHIVLAVPDPTKSIGFYRDVLGFRVSDVIHFEEGAEATFLHCNERHHSLAIAQSKDDQSFISHFMVEVNSLQDVGCGYDLCLDGGTPIFMHLGQHTNDRMVSFYLISPSGFRIEYGFGGLQLDVDTWHVRSWDSPKIWGHRRTAPHSTIPKP